jgi:hypothetical protein
MVGPFLGLIAFQKGGFYELRIDDGASQKTHVCARSDVGRVAVFRPVVFAGK